MGYALISGAVGRVFWAGFFEWDVGLDERGWQGEEWRRRHIQKFNKRDVDGVKERRYILGLIISEDTGKLTLL